MKIRSDHEAIAAYREAMLVHLGLDTSDMSDQEVYEKMDAIVTAAVQAAARVARHMAQAMQQMMPHFKAIGQTLVKLQEVEWSEDEPS